MKTTALVSFCSFAAAFNPITIKNQPQRVSLNLQPMNPLFSLTRMPHQHVQPMRKPAFSACFSQLANADKDPEALAHEIKNRPIEYQEATLKALFGEHVSKKDSWLSDKTPFHQLQALVQMGCSVSQAAKRGECPLLKHEQMADLIALIASLDRPEYHQELLSAFDRIITMPAMRQCHYMEQTKSLSLYGLPQSMLIFPMVYASSLSVDEQKTVLHDYGNKGFKNAFKLTKALNFVIWLRAFERRPNIQGRLLLATCPSVDDHNIGKKQSLPKLLANINLMQVVMSCLEAGGSDIADVDLADLTSPKILLESVKQVAIFVLGHEPTAENCAAMERYFDRAEDPSCLLIWAARQKEYCKKSHSFKNLEAVKKISSWIIHEDQLSRYQENPTLSLLQAKNKQAYRRWCELEAEPHLAVTPASILINYSNYGDANSCVELDFEGLVEDDKIDAYDRLIEVSRTSGWDARVTSNLEDILTCGTHVPGSCQHVYESGSLNQGLIGYIKAAKMAGVWKGEALFGRNMLFLGWDEIQEKHVIVMAHHSYGQPECDKGYRELMKLAAQKYANWVGLELVDAAGSSHDPLNLVAQNTREIVLPLRDPTYIDGMGVCSSDIRLKIKE